MTHYKVILKLNKHKDYNNKRKLKSKRNICLILSVKAIIVFDPKIININILTDLL